MKITYEVLSIPFTRIRSIKCG